VIVWRRRSRHKRRSRAVVSGARPAIVVETATSPLPMWTGARSPAIIARVVVTRSGAAIPTSRRTRPRPRSNLHQDPHQGPRHRNRRTPRPSTVEWSCPTACPAGEERGSWRRAARPAPATSTGGSVLAKTACMGWGRTAAGTARTKDLEIFWRWTIRASRRPSRPQSPRRTAS